MAKIRYSITHNSVVYPLDLNGKFSMEYTTENDKIFYNVELASNLIAGGSKSANKDAYLTIKEIEDGLNRCLPILFLAEVLCDGEWSAVFEGRTSINECVFNEDICTIQLKITPNDTYQCISDNDTEINILSGTTKVQLNWFNSQIYEFLLCPNNCGPPLCNGESVGITDGWREGFRNCTDEVDGTGVSRVIETSLGSITPYSKIQGDYFVYYNDTVGVEAFQIYDYGADFLTTIFSSAQDVRPYAIDGDYVGLYSRETNTVYVYEISTSTLTTVRTGVTNMGNDDMDISGDYLLYQDRALNEVALYQISTATEIIIETANDVEQVFIDGDYCVYYLTSPNPDTLKVYDIVGATLTGVSVSIGITNISLSGIHLFWAEPSGGGTDLNHLQLDVMATTLIVNGTLSNIDSADDSVIWISGQDIFLWQFSIGSSTLSSGLGASRDIISANINCGNVYFHEFASSVTPHFNHHYWYEISSTTLTQMFTASSGLVAVPFGSIAVLQYSIIYTDDSGANELKEYVFGTGVQVINSNVSSGYTTFGNDCLSLRYQDDANNKVYYYRGAIKNTSKMLIAYRETTTAPCVGGVPEAPTGLGWQLYQNNCAFVNESVWVRYPAVGITIVVGDCVTPPSLTSAWYLIGCQVFPTETVGYWYNLGVIDSYTRFRRIDDVIDKMATTICPQIVGIKSDFFQINPDTPSATDIVTGDPIRVNHLLIAQKSDIKRPNSTEPATRGDIKLVELLDYMKSMFQVYWFIDVNNYLRIEHITFFRDTLGLDLTASQYDPYLNGINSYKYDISQLQKSDKFTWMEAGNIDFIGKDILYTESDGTKNLCVGTNEVDNLADRVTTDVPYIRELVELLTVENEIDDDGFVICASLQLTPLEYNVYLDVGKLSGTELANNKLSWANLHHDYWVYERPASKGFLNGAYISFITVKRTKLQDEFKVPFCCDDLLTFDPSKLIKTNFGSGVVVSATYSSETDLITLQLIY